MKKLFTKFLVLFLALIATVTLVGCKDGGDDADTTDYNHTIIFYSSQGDSLQTQTKIAIDNFEAKYPGWKVVHTGVGGYDDVKSKVVSDLQGGLQPDLAYCYSDHVAQYIQTSKVVDMSTLIAKGNETIKTSSDKWATSSESTAYIGYTAEEIADFVPGYYAEGLASNFGGASAYGYADTAMLTLPFVKSTELVYYNKTALDACELEVATTWDELWAQCDTLRQAYPSATPLGYDSEANWFITMCQQNGWGYTTAADGHYLFNNEQAQAWLTELNGYYDKGYIVTQQEYGSYTSNLFTKGENDGGIIYCVGSSGGASYQASSLFEWGIAPLFGSVQGDQSVNKSVISQGPSLVMLYNDRADDKDEKAKMTFLFVKELLDPTFQATFSMAAGYNPCRISTKDIPAYAEFLEGDKITAVAASVASTMTNDFFTSPAFVGSSTARTQVGNALVYALTGEKSATKALKDAYDNCGGK